MTLDKKNRIFPGEYEKNQINLFYDIQYNEQSSFYRYIICIFVHKQWLNYGKKRFK